LERSQDTKFGAPPPTNRLIDLHSKPTPNFNDSRRYGDQFERTLPNITQDISCMLKKKELQYLRIFVLF
jgi:hypothetical protein